MNQNIKVAAEVWIAAALLQHENPHQEDFSVAEIVDRVAGESIASEFRPGVPIHVSQHCVANKRPNPNNYRMLYETGRGRRRLFRPGDEHHPFRKNGKVLPDPVEIPKEYQYLLEWYEQVYCGQAGVYKEESPPEMKTTCPNAPEEYTSNTEKGQWFQRKAAEILSAHYGVEFLLGHAIPIGDPAKEHRFDLVSVDKRYVGECKNYRWTESGKVPSAKISCINEALLYLSFLHGIDRLVVMPRSLHPSRKESLAQYYCRTYQHLLKNVQVIEIEAETATVIGLGQEGKQHQSEEAASRRERSTMPNIEAVWARIQEHEGEEFHQIRGKAFHYGMFGGYIVPSTVNQQIAKSDFEKALQRVPLRNTVPVQDLRGPSYIYAILMDKRIHRNDW